VSNKRNEGIDRIPDVIHAAFTRTLTVVAAMKRG
jgi:hypothetical protein